MSPIELKNLQTLAYGMSNEEREIFKAVWAAKDAEKKESIEEKRNKILFG